MRDRVKDPKPDSKSDDEGVPLDADTPVKMRNKPQTDLEDFRGYLHRKYVMFSPVKKASNRFLSFFKGMKSLYRLIFLNNY